MTAGSSFSSQVSSTVHIGLGSATAIDTLEVSWSPTKVQTFTQLTVDRRHDITEGGTISAASTKELPTIPRTVRLRAYPNPFNASTTVELQLDIGQDVVIELFDLLGQPIEQIEVGHRPAGSHRWRITADRWSTGCYVVRATTASEVQTLPLLLLK